MMLIVFIRLLNYLPGHMIGSGYLSAKTYRLQMPFAEAYTFLYHTPL